jgi:hypothetical protein
MINPFEIDGAKNFKKLILIKLIKINAKAVANVPNSASIKPNGDKK